MNKRKIVELESTIRKSNESSRKKHKLLPNITTFKISDDNLKEFVRHFPKPMDCVINALQILKYIDFKTAAMLRLLVGNDGIDGHKIEQIFNMINNYKFDYKFKEYHLNYNELKNVFDEFLQPGHVMFLGVSRNYTNESLLHVTVVGRYLNGDLVVIDPQFNHSLEIGLKPIVINDFKEWANMYQTFYLLTIENLSDNVSLLPDVVTLRAKSASQITTSKNVFKVKDSALSSYLKSNPTPKYAIINSLELIGYVELRTLYLLQIVMFRDVGLCLEDLENMLTVINEYNRFTFIRRVDDSFEQFIKDVKSLPNGFLTYCGVKWYTGGKHPIIMGKTSDGTPFIVNPQTWYIKVLKTDADYAELRTVFKHMTEYYTLQQQIL